MSEVPGGLVPAQTALVVMDYQAGVLASLHDADGLLARTACAIDTVRHRGGRVAFVRIGLTDADYKNIRSGSPMAERVAAYAGALDADSPNTAIVEAVAPAAGDIVVRKCRVGAFSTTDLDERLRAAGISTLVLAGLTTSGVVLTTVREAFDRDYRVYVLSDACADHHADVHAFLLEKVFPRQAVVLTLDTLKALLGDPKEG